MVKLLAGMDVSGSPQSGNHVFLSIVFCTRTGASDIFQHLGKKTIHMSKLDTKTQNKIIASLKFDWKESVAFCIKVNRNEIIDRFHEMRNTRHKNISRGKTIRVFNKILFGLMREQIQSFLIVHGCTFGDVLFQCDHDCMGFAKDTGLKHVKKGNVYAFSDIVAWANNRGKEPSVTVRLDLTKDLEAKLKKPF